MTYPCRCTRAEIRAALAAPQEGAPRPAVYPGTCRGRTMAEAGPGDAIRLDLARALGAGRAARFEEIGTAASGPHASIPRRSRRRSATWCWRGATSAVAYHLAVVVDDALQGVTHVVRGADLWEATPLHRLLQALLGLPVPVWHHHRLVRDEAGRRLAKRDDARSLAACAADGVTPDASGGAMVGASGDRLGQDDLLAVPDRGVEAVGRLVWQAGPVWSTISSRLSRSQSTRSSTRRWTWPEVAPLRQSSPRERDQ